MDYTGIKAEVQQRIREILSKKRYEHSIGVCRTAEDLARHYGCNVEKAAISALLHDIARDFTTEEMKSVILQDDPDAHFSIQILKEPVLLHAAAGAAVARCRFGITDEDILRSIAFHTTGGPGMGMLERIVFVADFIEPGRNMSGVKRVRRLAKQDLDGAVLRILKLVIAYLIDRDKIIMGDSIDAYNDIILNRTN
jgi:predicted HD superfamily hydrolase involved in NAD metabolism